MSKADDFILNYAMKDIRNRITQGMFLENSLAHIRSMNSQMKFAHKVATYSSVPKL
jgi:hypothetical protein